MFGLPSIQKLIVLGLVIAAVWYGFKFLGRLQSARKAEAKLRAAESRKAPKKTPEPPAADNKVADLVPCPICGAYVESANVPSGPDCSCGRKA